MLALFLGGGSVTAVSTRQLTRRRACVETCPHLPLREPFVAQVRRRRAREWRHKSLLVRPGSRSSNCRVTFPSLLSAGSLSVGARRCDNCAIPPPSPLQRANATALSLPGRFPCVQLLQSSGRNKLRGPLRCRFSVQAGKSSSP